MPGRQKRKMTRSEKGLIFILILVGALGFFYFKGVRLQNQIWAVAEAKRVTLENIYFNAFGKLKLAGKSAVVFDPVKAESIFTLNSGASFPMASIVKVMTAITSLEAMPESTII